MLVNSTLHTIIIWESGFNYISEILWELQQTLKLLEINKYNWQTKNVSDNLTKLYPNRDFDNKSEKLKSIGGNNLFVLIGIDIEPNIIDKQNINALKIKQKLRKKYNKNFLHISDNENEAFYNYKAFKNISKEDFSLKKEYTKLNLIKSISENIEIVNFNNNKFLDIQDVFNILNKYENWVILRNWEGLPESVTSNVHEDVDILTMDYYRTLTLLNAKPKFKEENRVHFFIETKSKIIPFDIRFLGDNYYDRSWQEKILDNKVLENNSFFRLKDEDYFWTLLYHAIYHKNRIIDDYKVKLTRLIPLNLNIKKEVFNSFSKSKKLLKKYLSQNKIKITKPIDSSVKIKKSVINKITASIRWYFVFFISIFKRKRKINLEFLNEKSSLNHNFSNAKILKRNVFASGNYIIKVSDKNKRFLLVNEKQLLEKVKKYKLFPDVKDYFEINDKSYLIIEKFNGKDLYRKTFYTKKQKEIIIRDLTKIIEALKKEKITHYDIRPHNLVLTNDSLYLIDFQFATQHNKAINTNDLYEEMILDSAMKNIGGEWRAVSCKNEDIDFLASQNIINNYINMPFQKKIKNIILMIKKRLLRYVNYK